MPRHLKQGVDFVPVDVDFFDDNKFFLLQEKYPCKGFYYLMNIWIEIYKSSYYLEWDETTQVKFCRRINVSRTDFQEVLDYIIEIGLLSPEMYGQYNILTSSGIQMRWVKAVKRRKSVVMIREFTLIRQLDIDAVKASGLVIENLSGEVESWPVKVTQKMPARKNSEPEKEETPEPPSSDLPLGAHSIDFVRDFISIPYELRTEEFKADWSETYYASYQWFSSLIIKEYQTFHTSVWQISLKDYKELWLQFKWHKDDVVAALDKMSGSGNIKTDTGMKNRLKMFLETVMKAKNNKYTSPVQKPVKEVVLYDATKSKPN